MNPTHKNDRANSKYATIQSKQERIKQFEFDIVIVNQNSSMIRAQRSFSQVRYNPNPNKNVEKIELFFQFNRLHYIYQANSIL